MLLHPDMPTKNGVLISTAAFVRFFLHQDLILKIAMFVFETPADFSIVQIVLEQKYTRDNLQSQTTHGEIQTNAEARISKNMYRTFFSKP